MILLKCLIVLIGILYCHPAPAAKIRCGRPPVIPNAEPPSNLKEETYEASKTIIYTCMPGYVRQGSLRLICSDAGKWEFIGSEGVCKKKPCGYPGDAEYGTFELVEGDEFVFGAIVQYKCDNGYYFTTRYTKRECTATGWSNFPPVCEIKRCPPIKVEDNVDILYTSQDGELTVGQVVRFECRSSGQTLEGASDIFCTSEGKWNENAPTCKDISCTLPVIVHGNPKTRGQQNFQLKDTLDFECDNGYKPTRTPPTICTASGWSPTPMCEEIVCYLENVDNGKIKNPKRNQIYRLGETVELECSRDFQPEGDPDEPRRCTSYGWSPSLKCISKQCHRPDIPNGNIAGNYWGRLPSFPLNVGDSFYYSCDRGYSPTNRYWNGEYGITYCRREGWNPPPGCLKQCPIPSPEERKALFRAEKEYFEGDTMEFRCYEGYKTKDRQTSGVMTCLNGKFTEEKCIRVCQKPDVKNGFINTTETEFEVGSYLLVTCNEGFYFGKNKVTDNIQCTNNNWNPNPVCKEITCQVNKKTFKSSDVVQFTCANCQTLKSQCYYFGWGPSLPSSQESKYVSTLVTNEKNSEVTCPPASAPPNAYIKNPEDILDEAEIACHPGYKLDGSEKMFCQNGTWKWDSTPVCIQQKKCVPPPQIPKGKIIEEKDVYYTGQTVKYRCTDGYRIIGSDTSSCVDKWWSTPPTCEEQPCGKPEEIENGRVISDEAEFKPGLHTIYECFDGYSLSPNAAKCSLGKWQYPTCIDSSCRPPEAIEHGKVIRITSQNKKSQENTGKYFRGDQAEYQCDSTYTMKGNKFVTCENATWTKTPECSKIGASCGTPPSVNFGDTTETKKTSYPSGSFITYVCINLYTLDGNKRIQCKDGKWEQEPVCREPYTVTESDMETNNIKLKYKPNDKKIYCSHAAWLSFECLDGYNISDKTLLRIQCWDGKVRLPKCLKQGFCVLDRSIMNVNNIRYGNDEFVENGNVITFECADGLTAENTLETKCINGEIIYPKCVSGQCSAPNILHAKNISKQNTYDSGISLDVECQDSFVIKGPRTITCKNGEWGNLPHCYSSCRIDAEGLKKNNLELESQDDLLKTHEHDAGVNVKCKGNFKYQGSPTAICNNGKMKYQKCFTGNFCRIDQDKLEPHFLVLDERHEDAVFYGEGETVYFKCKFGSQVKTGSCAKNGSLPWPLTYPTDCPNHQEDSISK